MKTALCPSCNIKKYSAAHSKDGLCYECGGRANTVMDPEHTCECCDQLVILKRAVNRHRETIIANPSDNPETLEKQGHADAVLWGVLDTLERSG